MSTNPTQTKHNSLNLSLSPSKTKLSCCPGQPSQTYLICWLGKLNQTKPHLIVVWGNPTNCCLGRHFQLTKYIQLEGKVLKEVIFLVFVFFVFVIIKNTSCFWSFASHIKMIFHLIGRCIHVKSFLDNHQQFYII